jgi:hypothetical protein
MLVLLTLVPLVMCTRGYWSVITCLASRCIGHQAFSVLYSSDFFPLPYVFSTLRSAR